jgi:hypothetical protein
MLLIAHILLVSSAMADGPLSTKSQVVAGGQIPVKSLPFDPQKLAASINGSFYRPDQLSGLQCAVSVDWAGFYNGLKIKVPEARLHAIDGVQIHYTAIRNKTPDVTFNWVNGEPDTRDQLEGGIKQIVGGFYQTYWPLMASPPITKAAEIQRIEPQADGTKKIYESDANNKVVIDLDKNDTPTHYAFDTPAFKGAFDLQFVDSPEPTANDLRRISQLHLVTNIGASSLNVQVDLDYQPVEGYVVPRHVTYNVVGAYSISMEFIGCSAIKAPAFVISPAQ